MASLLSFFFREAGKILHTSPFISPSANGRKKSKPPFSGLAFFISCVYSLDKNPTSLIADRVFLCLESLIA